MKPDTQTASFVLDSIELEQKQKALLKEKNLEQVAMDVQSVVTNSTPASQPIVGVAQISGVQPCTDCNGANPCTDCAEPPTLGPIDKPVTKDAWIDINIPNQGDPTVEQQKELEAEKRKRILLIGVLLLALLLIALFAVKMFKKS